jgi:hypothetical protein
VTTNPQLEINIYQPRSVITKSTRQSLFTMNDDDASKTLERLSLSDLTDEIFMLWFESNKPDLTELFTRLQKILAWKGVGEEKIASVIKLAVGFSDTDTRDLLWSVEPEEKEAVWGSGKRVLCDDVRLVKLAREGDLLKFIKNSWVPVTQTGTQHLTQQKMYSNTL